jgi:hypothetical protein
VLQLFWTRISPVLQSATKLYSDSCKSHPNIPMTVFTRNIDTILAKKIKRVGPATMDDPSTTFSPISSLTGGATTTTVQLSQASAGGVASRKPLKDTLLAKTTATGTKIRSKESSEEIHHQSSVALLEDQLGLRSTGANQLDVSYSSKSCNPLSSPKRPLRRHVPKRPSCQRHRA